jgi:hypothetical protein
MANRKVYAPYSTTGEQVGQTPVEGYVDVKQEITPIILTGELGKDGEWSGVTVSDKQFLIDTTHAAVGGAGAAVLSPQKSDHEYIDMTGFRTIFIAIKTSSGGAFAIEAVMGPDSYAYANLNPVNAATTLKGGVDPAQETFENIFVDSSETLTANTWNIFPIQNRLANQKLLQFKITNNSGAPSDIQFASLRVV